MYSENQKNVFALLRAEGESFKSIGNKLNVPVRTLFSRAKDMSDDICDLKIAAYESASDSLKTFANKRIQSMIKDLNQINKNINPLVFKFCVKWQTFLGQKKLKRCLLPLPPPKGDKSIWFRLCQIMDLGFDCIDTPTLLRMKIIPVNLMKCHIKIKN